MKAYKGFGKDLKCRDFQYEIGKEYTEESASLCNSGFHACEFPLDCFGAEIGLKGIIDASVKFILEKVNFDNDAATNTGDNSAATNTGYNSAATNTGDNSAATNTGAYSAATNTGRGGVAITTGYASRVKAEAGGAIVCAERGEWNGKEYPLLSICAAIVDGEKIKADTWYTVKNGVFVEID